MIRSMFVMLMVVVALGVASQAHSPDEASSRAAVPPGLFGVSPNPSVTVPNITANCVSVGYVGGNPDFKTVKWEDVDQLHENRRPIAVRVFHQQGTAPTPSNEVQISHWDVISLHSLNTGNLLTKRSGEPGTVLAGASLRHRIFRLDNTQLDEVRDEKFREEAHSGAGAVLILALNNPTYDDQVSDFFARTDVGPCQ